MTHGYLRRDDDCHWFLIPEDKVDKFDSLFSELDYAQQEDNYELEDVIIGMINDFWEYRIDGPFDLLIPMDNLKENN